jgi:uncharacterized protein (DUF1800 family)
VSHVIDVGYSAWIDEQFAKPQASHRAAWEAADAAARAADPADLARTRDVLDSFYRQAVGGNDQLRQRVAFALSEIFVVSMVDGSVVQHRAAWQATWTRLRAARSATSATCRRTSRCIR